jgi:predicted methyltransferase
MVGSRPARRELTAEFAGETNLLKATADPHAANLFDAAIRGKTDQLTLKFVRANI